MQEKNEKEINLNILKHLEDLSNEINEKMASRTKNVFQKYPLTFGLLILFGVIAVIDGMRGLMESFGLFRDNPWYLIIIGLLILTITGTLYKKLDQKKLD